MPNLRIVLLACLSMLGLSLHAPVLAQDYPLTLQNHFGTTVIPEKPERIATVAFANFEVPLALGVVPVGFTRASYGDDDDDGLLPWVAARLKELGADTPVLFDEGDGIDFEAVAATRPDVILAAYSGLSQSDYETLSLIAPVVAYPDNPYATEWREMIRLNSAGMGMAAEGEALVQDLDARIAASAARYPELAGKSAMFITHLDTTDLSTVNFYTTADTRVKFFEDLGLTFPSSVEDASASGLYAGQVSAERIDTFDDVDILVTYGGEALMTALKADPLLSRMPAVANGAVVMLNNDPQGNGANPTPLSIPWVLDGYVDQLAAAARAAQ